MEGELSVRYDSSAHGVLSVHDMRNASRRTAHCDQVQGQVEIGHTQSTSANSSVLHFEREIVLERQTATSKE